MEFTERSGAEAQTAFQDANECGQAPRPDRVAHPVAEQTAQHSAVPQSHLAPS